MAIAAPRLGAAKFGDSEYVWLGVGLDLAIAQRAIALHHGRVWADNAQPGT